MAMLQLFAARFHSNECVPSRVSMSSAKRFLVAFLFFKKNCVFFLRGFFWQRKKAKRNVYGGLAALRAYIASGEMIIKMIQVLFMIYHNTNSVIFSTRLPVFIILMEPVDFLFFSL